MKYLGVKCNDVCNSFSNELAKNSVNLDDEVRKSKCGSC